VPFLFHTPQNRAHDGSNNASLHCFLALLGHVLHELVRQLGNGQRLQPDSPRPSERCEKDSVPAKNHVLDPPPPNWGVCVVIWMELVIQESSPASEITDSLGSRANSSTGMVVPMMRLAWQTPGLDGGLSTSFEPALTRSIEFIP